ncbi:unnamed protein product [Rhizophagus irregularis]|nr:unnamed protein product [Rhizophagus irregularis]
MSTHIQFMRQYENEENITLLLFFVNRVLIVDLIHKRYLKKISFLNCIKLLPGKCYHLCWAINEKRDVDKLTGRKKYLWNCSATFSASIYLYINVRNLFRFNWHISYVANG